MIYMNEIENMKIVRRRGRLPIDENDKRRGSAVILVTPNIESSINMINHDLIRNMYHHGYYIERSIMYYVNNENQVMGCDGDEIILEGNDMHVINENAFVNEFAQEGLIDATSKPTINEEYKVTDHGIYINNNGRMDMMLFDDFDEADEIESIQEGSFGHAAVLRQIFYRERIRRRKEVYEIHDKIKAACPAIDNTAISYRRYRKRNIFTDFYYYNEIFYRNNYYNLQRGYNLYMDILGRFMNDKRLDRYGYNTKVVFIPVQDWVHFTGEKDNLHRYRDTINPISVIYEGLRSGDKELVKRWGNAEIVLFSNNRYFKIDLQDEETANAGEFLMLLRRLTSDVTAKPKKTEKEDDKEEKDEEPESTSTWDRVKGAVTGIGSSRDEKDETLVEPDYDPDKKSSLKLDMSGFDTGMENIKDIGDEISQDLDDEAAKEMEEEQKHMEELEAIEDEKQSRLSIMDDLIATIEGGTKIQINNLTGESGEATMDEIIEKIESAAESSYDSDEAMDLINDDEELKEMLKEIREETEKHSALSAARIKRNKELKEKSMDIKIDDRTVEEILKEESDAEKAEPMSLDIDSINEDWEELDFPNFEEMYNVEDDLMKMMMDLSSENKEYPIGIRDIEVEDTSDPENYKKTYTFHLEDSNGKRNQLKLDIPEFVDDKYLMLGGGKKTITRQLMLMPVVKTDDDTVQIVSNYMKIFIRRFGSRKFVISDRIIKFIKKLGEEYRSVKVTTGNSTRANVNYSLPIDYMEIAENFNKIDTKDYIFFFDQSEIHSEYRDEIQKSKDKFPVGWNKKSKEIIYCQYDHIYSILLKELLITQHKDFKDMYESTNESTSYSYTRATILGKDIPLIIILSYLEGLITVMDKAGIKYTIHRTRPQRDPDTEGIIRFKDTYIKYDIDYESSLLMNGLKTCATEDYKFVEVAKKPMYLDFLDNFGGRILADGLDNFYELFIDPITREVLEDKNMPTEFVDLLLYANIQLSDTGSSRHTDMNNVRYRSNEIVAACAYKVIAKAYGDYKIELKRGRNAKMTAKQSAVIDEVLSLNNVNESSELTPFLEAEELTAVSSKGPSGLNTERAYGLDKRAYEDTMRNVLAQSTPQGKGIGVNRQTTMNPNVSGKRGYIKPGSKDDSMSVAKSMNVSEAITSFGATRDDPSRTSMNLSQSRHTMRVKRADPLLISNGVDEAMPHFLSNTFSYKAKRKGRVEELKDEFLILKYDNGDSEFVNLEPEIKKNSNSGFYVPVKLTTDLKKGDAVEKNQIVAYDSVSYSKSSGPSTNIAATPGTFSKIAVLQTDEGFEDSVIISESVADKMTSEIIEKIDIYVEKSSNVYDVVKKGQRIREGQSLIVLQNASDDEDVGILLRSLTDDEEEISKLGRVPIKSKHTGVIEDVKTFRTVNKADLSPSLRREVNRTENELKEKREILEQYNVEHINRLVDKPDKKDPTGRFKNVRDGVLFEFYIRYDDKMAIGDKLTFFTALKGIVRDIFPEGKEPYTDFRKDEPIDALLSVGSINSRMVTSIKFNMFINKIIIELGRQSKDILGIKYDTSL